MIISDLSLSLAATVISRWIDIRTLSDVSLQLDCGDLASPVGVVTVEFSNDKVCENEIAMDVAPGSTTAVLVDATSTLTVKGTALAAGYDGVGAKATFASFPIGLPGYFRVKFTRTSGGATDVLHVRTIGR